RCFCRFPLFINVKKIESNLCEKFPNLENIRILNTRFSNFDENTFDKCEKLKFIYFQNKNIQNITKNLFSKASELNHFSFEECGILSLPDDLFINKKKLNSISFYGNEIVDLPANIFQEQYKLKTLYLGRNKIETLDPLLFRDLISLSILDLSSNLISELPNSVFDSCINLKYLGLAFNKIKIINPELFRSLWKLEKLYFSGNKIVTLEAENFKYLSSLEHLDLNYNKIQSLNSKCFHGLQKLKILGLGSNQISELPQGIFAPLKNLEELGLNSNGLKIIHSDSFGIHRKLKLLVIGENGMIAFDEEIIDNTRIYYIDMIGNNCYGSEIDGDTVKIKSELKQCFNNYKPRTNQETTCGKQKLAIGTVIGGSQVTKGSFPWTAALIKNRKDLFCGATLITKTKVLTAAHCIENKLTNSKLRPQEILVLVGVHDLNIPHEVGKVSFAVKNITVHPDWHPLIQSYDADIAILELDGQVHFTNYIQPICLAAPESSESSIASGLVVGFGKSEFTDIENIARKVNMPIHSYRKCVESSDHESLVSHRTICGGYANGTGVCRGDSGSGLIVKSNGIYYLLGIVSSSLYGGEYECNVHAYSVFTDVTKFHNWILTGNVY
ncbi:uncharacterized protein, partial [Chironomus tepperi]|uniref:uncharacterized protein n=1 Tax=Chironomus tepperi TaxID=113505 RepID=UPI00391F734D